MKRWMKSMVIVAIVAVAVPDEVRQMLSQEKSVEVTV